MSERHERVARLLSEHAPPAPPSLRARVEAERNSASRSQPAAPIRARFALAGAAGVAALAVAFVAPALFDSEDIGALDVHALGSRGAVSGPPPPQPGSPELLSESVDGVAFPAWGREFGWRAIGYRNDTLADRETETVLYTHEGHTIAYTVVAGEPLEIPEGAVERRIDGVDVAALGDDHGHEIVVFERGGHTCVLSGHVEHRSTLLELASWRGGGNVTF